jgi:hypothetical protein
MGKRENYTRLIEYKYEAFGFIPTNTSDFPPRKIQLKAGINRVRARRPTN